MPERISTKNLHLEAATNRLCGAGSVVFSVAIAGLGVETFVCARYSTHSLGPGYNVIPVLPWLPAIPWLATIFGAVLAACGVGMLVPRTKRTSGIVLGGLLFLGAVLLDAPKYAAHIGNMSLRTIVFESLSLASLACLSTGWDESPKQLAVVSRILLGAALVVFGVDHFLAIRFIATLIPAWIPWRAFWVVFFGVGMIAAGLSIGINFLARWAAACIGLMFGIWVVTLHLPRVLGLYGIAGAPRDPNEWSSLFIALALWGGFWALTRDRAT